MKNYDFDRVPSRKNTDSVKWDYLQRYFGQEDVLPMWVADMDFPSPPAVSQALEERVQHQIYGYTAPPDSLRAAICHWIRRKHDWEVEEEWLILTTGVIPAMSTALHTFTRPGDTILIQPPVYPPFFSLVTKNGRKLVENPLTLQNGSYSMDLEDLAGKVKDVEMLFLCSPHNPVGRIWTREELEQLGELASKEVVVVSDEIWWDLSLGEKHVPFGSLPAHISGNSITCISPSKTFNIPGLKVGAAIIPDHKLRRRFVKELERRCLSGGNIFGFIAAEAAYSEGDEWLYQLKNYLQGNIDFLLNFFTAHLPEIKVIKPQGTFVVWLDFRGLRLTEDELRELILKQARVGLISGLEFGREGAGFQRINIACPREGLKEGLERILEAVKARE